MLATSYLSRRWPAKYFRLCKSLRPCSGWERVVSSCLVTNKLSFAVYRLFSAFSLYAESCIRYIHQFITFSAYSRLCNQRLLRLLRFRFVRNGAIVVLRFQFVIAYAMPNSSSAPPCGFRKSPRPISNTRLKMLPLLHLCPINVVIYNGTY